MVLQLPIWFSLPGLRAAVRRAQLWLVAGPAALGGARGRATRMGSGDGPRHPDVRRVLRHHAGAGGGLGVPELHPGRPGRPGRGRHVGGVLSQCLGHSTSRWPASSKTCCGRYTQRRHLRRLAAAGHRPDADVGTAEVDQIQSLLFSYQPDTEAQSNLQAQAIGQFNDFVSARRYRINESQLALPALLWMLLWVGALINQILISLIEVKEVLVHIIIASLISLFVAMLIYVTLQLDHPFYGAVHHRSERLRDRPPRPDEGSVSGDLVWCA